MIRQFGHDVKALFKIVNNPNKNSVKCLIAVSSTISLALFIIGALALMKLNSSTCDFFNRHLWWMTCGMASLSLLTYLATNPKERPYGSAKEIAEAATLIVLGLLTISKVLDQSQLAYGILGVYLIAGGIYCLAAGAQACGRLTVKHLGNCFGESQSDLLRRESLLSSSD